MVEQTPSDVKLLQKEFPDSDPLVVWLVYTG